MRISHEPRACAKRNGRHPLRHRARLGFWRYGVQWDSRGSSEAGARGSGEGAQASGTEGAGGEEEGGKEGAREGTGGTKADRRGGEEGTAGGEGECAVTG